MDSKEFLKAQQQISEFFGDLLGKVYRAGTGYVFSKKPKSDFYKFYYFTKKYLCTLKEFELVMVCADGAAPKKIPLHFSEYILKSRDQLKSKKQTNIVLIITCFDVLKDNEDKEE